MHYSLSCNVRITSSLESKRNGDTSELQWGCGVEAGRTEEVTRQFYG